MGSSIIKRAFCAARKEHGGANLNMLIEKGVFWQGKAGMRWADVLPKIKQMSQYEDPPKLLVIHCGGNDVGLIPAQVLRGRIRKGLQLISTLLPKTKIVWSQILPRNRWRADKSGKGNKALNKARVRVNASAANFVLAQGGFYVRYPGLDFSHPDMFLDDLVHLSGQGNQVFLGNLREALKNFYSNKSFVYPA